jgi:aldehyde dehydrogenase (NAD+)
MAAATEEVAGAVPSVIGADVEVAVAAARKAFDAGPRPQASPADRAAALDRLAAAIEARAEDTARLVTAEMGMPIRLSRRNNVSIPCGIIRYYAVLVRDSCSEEMREAVSFAGRTMVRREPVGVAAVIASWSYPNSGQACFTMSRVLAPRSRYDEAVEALAWQASVLVVGDPMQRVDR